MPSYRDAQPPGFEITPELSTWETLHRCPRCHVEMFAGERSGFRIEACGRCGGVWVTGEEAQRALATGSRAAEELAARVAAVTRGVLLDDVPPLACPECAAGMSKARMGTVAIDTCGAHGTWFDRHELPRAMGALRGEPVVGVSSDERDLERMKPALSNEVQQVAHTIDRVIDALERALMP